VSAPMSFILLCLLTCRNDSIDTDRPERTSLAVRRARECALDNNRRVDLIVTRAPLPQQQASDLVYWQSRPMAERIAAVEALRAQARPESSDAEPRLQRVCRVARRSGR